MITVRTLAVSSVFLMALAPAWANDAGFESRVAELQDMSRAERQAAIQAMTSEERRGVWFALKQADRAENGAPPPADGFYRQAENQSSTGNGGSTAAANRAPGTITYDDGVSTITFGGGAIIGNRFNTHTGVPVLASGSVTQVQAVVIQGPAFTSNSAGFVLEGPQTVGGGAQAIFSTFTAPGTAVTETVTFSGLSAAYTGSSFFVLFGDFASVYVPAFGTGTTNGQGHHGVVGYTGGQGPNITGTFDFGETLNSLVRASGNILPVELIEYGVE